MLIGRERLAAACLVLLALGRPAGAQEVVANSFDQLRLVARLGEKMTITNADGAQVTGKLAALSPTSLTLLVGKSRRDLVEGDVEAITGYGHANLARGAKWGLGIGAGFGVLSGLAITGPCHGCGEFIASFTIIYAGLGAGIGVGMAAITPTRPMIYSAPVVERRRLAVSPIATRTRQGAAVSWTF